MGHAVGRVALGQEALADFVEAGQIGVKDFDRDAVAVLVRRFEHRRHPADANHTIEAPLAEHAFAQAPLRQARTLFTRDCQTRYRHPKLSPLTSWRRSVRKATSVAQGCARRRQRQASSVMTTP
jgi:hypothetical protein